MSSAATDWGTSLFGNVPSCRSPQPNVVATWARSGQGGDQVLHHGVVRNAEGQAVEFRLGVHKLLEAVLATWFFNPRFGDEAPIPWPYSGIDPGYEAAFSRMNSTLHLLDRAALHAWDSWQVLQDPRYEQPDGMHIDEFAPWLSAHDDIQIYTDAVVHYLYDHVNSLAATLAYVFPSNGPRLGQTFFSHRKAAINGASQDPIYSSIMADSTAWFDKLAATLDDPNPGVRTMLVHGLAVGDRGLRKQHGARLQELAGMVAGYLAMLERLYGWLSDRLAPLALEGSQLELVMSTQPTFMVYQPPSEEPALFNHWLFPLADEARAGGRAQKRGP